MRRPRFIAEQARNANGLLGRLVASIMARETWDQNMRAIERLDVHKADHILDVGCGHGRSLGEVAQRAPKGRVSGADPSELMVEIAVQRNRKLVKAHRIDVTVAAVEKLPFPDGAFDKALCVHVVYFWKDLDVALREIARVLKPGGCFVLLFRTNANAVAVQAYPPEVYHFPALATVITALGNAGFAVEDAAGPASAEPVLLRAVKAGL
jgi:ubiquinone/menaquinone biosynthesis C-methylase UbiE